MPKQEVRYRVVRRRKLSAIRFKQLLLILELIVKLSRVKFEHRCGVLHIRVTALSLITVFIKSSCLR